MQTHLSWLRQHLAKTQGACHLNPECSALATLKTRDVDRALMGKFDFDRTESHHTIYRLWLRVSW
ncbi:MAG: hypothetical protein EXR62_08125 [Chloroflexi bacterium]|nr:hypothetical protein [Chloroflexota bacterium]